LKRARNQRRPCSICLSTYMKETQNFKTRCQSLQFTGVYHTQYISDTAHESVDLCRLRLRQPVEEDRCACCHDVLESERTEFQTILSLDDSTDWRDRSCRNLFPFGLRCRLAASIYRRA
jgi:hypothetical protein